MMLWPLMAACCADPGFIDEVDQDAHADILHELQAKEAGRPSASVIEDPIA
jgi:hypothetical protein